MPRPLIAPEHQSTLATLAAVLLAAAAVYWMAAGGRRMIEIDRAEPLPYEFLVDVNSAEWPELAQLPEVGETLARRIVASRKAEGRFRSPTDLLRVDGIGRVRLARITPHLLPMPDDRAVAGN